MTAEIAQTIDRVLRPRGVAVVIEAVHECMTTRGVHSCGVSMVTSRMLGAFRSNPETTSGISRCNRVAAWCPSERMQLLTR